MPAVKPQFLSVALHLLCVALLLILGSRTFTAPPRIVVDRAHSILLAPPPPVHLPADRGGGSDTSAAPPRRGIAPPRSYRTFIPPRALPQPKLAMMPTIDFDVPPAVVATSNFGDPLGKYASGLYGDKGGSGIGDLPRGRGIGNAPGARGLSGRFGMPTKPAELIYRVDPEFSEEARKAKFQGMVVLTIEIGVDGRAHNPEVVESPGLGLDRKAVEAVLQWRFKPARRGGAPVPSTARVEVHFHLL